MTKRFLKRRGQRPQWRRTSMASLEKDKHGLIGEGQVWPHWRRTRMASLEKNNHGLIGEGQARPQWRR